MLLISKYIGVTVSFDYTELTQSEGQGDVIVPVSLVGLGGIVLDINLTVCISVEDDKFGMYVYGF